MSQLRSSTPVVLLLLSLCTLFSSLSAQSITSIRGCSVNANNRTSQCTSSTVITLVGSSFPSTSRQQSLTITVATSTCSNARYVNSTALTCRLPAVPSAGRNGDWLNVTAAWRNSNQTQPFAGVSYAVLSSSSSSTSRPITGATSSPSSSARSVTSSPTAAPSSSPPVIVAVHGCTDVGSHTANCTYSTRLTITGLNFGNRSGIAYFTLASSPAVTHSANDTVIICSAPTQQYEPYTTIPIRVQANGGRSAWFYGVTFSVIPPVVSALRSGSQRSSTLRVSPGATITVTGSSFPTSGSVFVVLNKTTYNHGAQYLGSPTVISTTELTATLPMNINADVQLNVPLPLSVTTYYSNSVPFTPGVVIVAATGLSSSTGAAGPDPVITSISGCEDDGNRTRSCLLYQPITLTITGRNFPTQLDRIVIGNNASPASCTPTTQYTMGTTVYCNVPNQSFMVNQVYQVWIFWKGGANATFYGVYFTDQLSPPTVESVFGVGCDWNGTAAQGCQRGSNAWLTITGQHFPLYLTPNITVAGSSCSMRGTRTKDRLVCRVTDTSLPANTLLPLRITFPVARTRSLDYHVLSFRAATTSSTGGRSGGNGSVTGGTRLSLEDELIIALLTTTTAVLLLVGAIFGVTYLRLRNARNQHTSGDGPWNEMVGGDGSRGFRIGDMLDEQPVVAAPYMPLVAQQLGAAGRGHGQGRGEGEMESWEGIPSPR